jgi:hypothetical protein
MYRYVTELQEKYRKDCSFTYVHRSKFLVLYTLRNRVIWFLSKNACLYVLQVGWYISQIDC